MTSRRWLLAVAATLSLLCCSCFDSKNPLADPAKAKADGDLAGVWRVKNPDQNVAYYHIACAGGKMPAGVMRAVVAVHAADGTINPPGDLLMFSTTIGEHHFLNMIDIEQKDIEQIAKDGWKPELVKGYSFVKYNVQGDTLTVWGIDPDAKGKAIEAGKIKGTVDENTKTFTDTSENLSKFLAAPENADIFAKEPTRLERVK